MNRMNIKNISSIVDGNLLLNESMSKHTTFGIGGNVDCYIMPKTLEQLKEILQYSNKHKINVFFMGSGSNMLVSDNGYNGIIISLKKTFKHLKIQDDATIIAQSGVMLGSMVRKATNKGIKGLESLVGVPGTVGGALYMNAGAYNHEISNYFKYAILLDKSGHKKIYKKNDVNFKYRYSSFPENEILIEAVFKYSKGNLNKISKNKKIASKKRRESQPLRYRSAGSIFKNPSDRSPAGYLIDKAGLKGLSVGGAEISKKHANFIINKNNATAKDVIKLISIIQKKILTNYNVKLNLEIKLLGFSNEE